MYIVFECLTIIMVGGLIWAFLGSAVELTICLKALASLFFVLAGLCGYLKNKESRRFSKFVLAALICSMAGDVFLSFDNDRGIFFLLGVASCTVSHIMFCTAFCKISTIKKKDFVVTGIAFLGMILLLFLGNFEFRGMLPVVVAYGFILAFMMAKAVSIWEFRKGRESAVYLIMAGGVLYMISDCILLFWMFGVGVGKDVQVLDWIVYYAAQVCFSASLSLGKFET